LGGGHRQHGPPVRGAEDWGRERRLAVLGAPELAEVELEGQLAAHGPQGQEGRQQLGEDEGEVDGVDGPLQRQDEDALVRQEEQQDGQLEQEAEQPEPGQLWNLIKRMFPT
ncbi:hypothetical protein ANANG_G00188460, partial [Anguilla anguilla]